ncbi:ImmA/IrrE family metallo-endopeptidase [Niallia sp. 01092]|uniref:ImmA/IrrE family metallo-endopeptidase n=1 Tax=unclassified Niallia TaxID=2837522 RepID=UPI003FD331C8
MESIIAKVQKLKKTHKTNCPFKLAEILGIEVLFENLGNTLGYYSRHFRIKVLHINENANEYQKKFTGAHELGHAVLHPDANTPFLKKHTLFSTDKIEMEANMFAINLLFSDEDFSDEISFHEAIVEYGIPEKLLITHYTSKFF